MCVLTVVIQIVNLGRVETKLGKISNLETGLKREKGFFSSNYMFNEDGESSKIQLISLKEYEILENQFHELNTYHFLCEDIYIPS